MKNKGGNPLPALASNQFDVNVSYPYSGVDPTAFTGDIHYTELSSRDYWRIWMDNLTVNGHAFKTGDLYSTVIDTGSTLLSGPPKLVEGVYARVPGAIKSPLAEEQGFYHVPCDAKISLSLELGGKYFAIQPQDMVYEPAKDGLCLGSLVAADLGGVHWVIGDAFLKNVYTVFRYEPPAVGFAALREPAPYRPGLPNIIKKTRL
jgi:cathepsin D